jgi:hypothetical protein
VAGPTGRVRRNVAPCPSALVTSRVPPCTATIPRHNGSPSPLPRPSGLLVKKGSKMRAWSAGGMPGPGSTTVSMICCAASYGRCDQSIAAMSWPISPPPLSQCTMVASPGVCGLCVMLCPPGLQEHQCRQLCSRRKPQPARLLHTVWPSPSPRHIGCALCKACIFKHLRNIMNGREGPCVPHTSFLL